MSDTKVKSRRLSLKIWLFPLLRFSTPQTTLRRTIPKAINSVWIRILLFYILGTLAISVLVPSNHPDLKLGSTAAKSPFVIAIKAAGIKGLPSVINAVLVTSATSAASSDIFTASRGLYSLALHDQAPRFFARTTKSGLPYVAVAFASAFGLLSYMGINSGSGKVFVSSTRSGEWWCLFRSRNSADFRTLSTSFYLIYLFVPSAYLIWSELVSLSSPRRLLFRPSNSEDSALTRHLSLLSSSLLLSPLFPCIVPKGLQTWLRLQGF